MLGEWLRPVFQTLWNYQSILLGLRFVLSFLLLLLPATAMGLTLPVLMEDSFLQSAEFGRAIGILYGVNTLGAVTGALLGPPRQQAHFADFSREKPDPILPPRKRPKAC